mgnify:CR=1 FL=1|jgi:thioredoxin-related protein
MRASPKTSLAKTILAAVGLWLAAVNPLAAAELVMFEVPGCLWCERWLDDIGPVYPKTDEGKRAPLRRVNLDQTLPDDLKRLQRPVFTPTFVLLNDDGEEIKRIVGYVGEDMFWWVLSTATATLKPAK